MQNNYVHLAWSVKSLILLLGRAMWCSLYTELIVVVALSKRLYNNLHFLRARHPEVGVFTQWWIAEEDPVVYLTFDILYLE